MTTADNIISVGDGLLVALERSILTAGPFLRDAAEMLSEPNVWNGPAKLLGRQQRERLLRLSVRLASLSDTALELSLLGTEAA